jgi:hypothetical protein
MNDADKEVELIVQSEDTSGTHKTAFLVAVAKCPWSPYSGNLKQVIGHMESVHYQKWCELALYPPISGGRY